MRNSKTLTTTLVLVVLAVVGAVLPFLLSHYYVDLLTMLFVNIILVSSFRLITIIGDWSLAHLPLMGAGAYASALITGTLGWPFWPSLLLSAIIAGVIALLMSVPLSRTTGFSFFIASYAAGEAMRLCWTRFRQPFGGHTGLANIPDPGSIGAVDFSRPIPYYFLALLITAVCLWLMYRVCRSRIGATFHAIHSQKSLARALGINVVKYKMLVFVIGGFFAGVAGVILVHRMWAISPNQFGFTPTLYLLVWVVFGGTGTFAGPIIGVSVLTLIDQLLDPLAEWLPMFYGAILILTLLFLPEGLEGVPKRLQSWYRRRQDGGKASEDSTTPENVTTEEQD